MKRLRLFLAAVGLRTRVFPLVTPPMGIMALAAYLRTKFDLDLMVVNQRLDNWSNDELARRAVEFEADVVGLSCLTTSAYMLGDITRKIRQGLPDALIVIGGPHASATRVQTLEQTNADAAVVGEGELVFEQLIGVWRDRGDFNTIPGLIWRDPDGRVVTNPGVTPQVEDLDSLPLPAYDLIDLPAYWRRQSIEPVFRRKYASLTSSRGCPYHCMWCHNIFGKRLRVHSPERIVEEIDYLQRTYGVNDFEFLDDNFNFHRERVFRFSELLQARDQRVKLAFPTGVRGDLVTQEVVDALIAAGMYQCGFALESGSPRVQKLSGKFLDLPRFLKAVEMTAARGVYVTGFCMMGFPTETEQELQQTIDVACSSQFHTAAFYTVTPFPGTPLYEKVAQTHPEKLPTIRYDDTDFSGMRVNLTDLPDEVLFAYQRKALRRFFFNPRRIFRLLRDHPSPWTLPAYIPIFLHRATKGLLARNTPGR